MTLRARALDELDALLDLPRSAQDARLDALRAEAPALAREVARLIEVDRRPVTMTEGRLDAVVGVAAATFDMPEMLGSYRVVREIGRGGMGVVYEAEQLRPLRRVALKTLPTLQLTSDALARLEQEVQALARVQHPGIPQVYEFFEHDGRPVIAMELVRGRPLDEALADADPLRAAAVLERVAEAIAWVHDRGVVHRDLKPSNVLVVGQDQPKVVDFGIATLGGLNTVAGGTPRYMAPEQRDGRLQDARVDVYALGVMARELLGDTSFRAGELAALLDRATAEDPVRRTATAHALADDLRRWRTLLPIRGVRTTALRRLVLFARRAPVLIATGSVALVLGLTVLGGVVSRTVAAWDAERLAALQATAADEAAAERLERLRSWEATAAPSATERRERYAALVDDPLLRGTSSLSDAWTAWADGEEDGRLAWTALTQAWVHAVTPAQERRARVRLSLAAWERGQWRVLEALADGLASDLPPEVAQAAASWRGDLEAVRRSLPEETAPLVALLEEARWETRTATARAFVEGRWIRAGPGRLTVTDTAGEVLEQVITPDGRVRLDRDGDEVLVKIRGRQGRFTPGSGQRRVALTEAEAPTQVTGRASGGGSVRASIVDPGVRLARTPASPGRTSLLDRGLIGGGYLADLQLLDVDGDGSDELIVLANGWRHTGLQVWDLDPEPPVLLHHRPQVPYRARVVSTDPPRLVVSEAEAGTTPRPFLPHLPPPVRTARLLRWDGGTWTEEHTLFSRGRLSGIQLADLDGDGLEDLILSAQDLTVLARRLDDGRFSPPLVLPDARSPLVVQADEDPAMELWLGGTLTPGVVLGQSGTGPLPPPPLAPSPTGRAPPDEASASAQRRWRRVVRLVEVGAVDQAVQGLADLGREPGRTGIEALRWGLDLAADRPAVRRRLAHRLLARQDALDRDTEHARDHLARAVHEIPEAVTDVWTGPGWPFAVLRPEAVLAELDGPVRLQLDATTAPVLALPVQLTEGPLVLQLQLSITDFDFGSGLALELATGSARAVLELQRVGGGPLEDHRLALTCGRRGASATRHAAIPTGPVPVRLSWDPRTGTVVCRAGEQWLRRSVSLGPPDEVRFTLGPRPSRFGPLVRMGVRLTELQLQGGRPVTSTPFRRDGAEDLGSPGGYAPGSASQGFRAAVAAGRQGRAEQARLAGLDTVHLARLLREDPDTWMDVVRARRPQDWVAAATLAYQEHAAVAPRSTSRALRPDLLAGLDPLDPEQRALLVLAATSRVDGGQARAALRLVERIPESVDEEAVWALRARLYALAGDEDRLARARARWRALARPSFAVAHEESP